MRKFVVTSCSTADLAKVHFEERNIPYVCFHYIIDGVEYPDDLGVSISFEDFYGKIAAGAMPTTSQVNVEQFEVFFRKQLELGNDILHISLSTGLSGAYQSANIAKEELLKDFPDRKIEIVDSLGASSGYGLLVDTAADMRDTGKSLEETVRWLNEHKLHLHHWFFSTDLSHYKRGGRISAASAAFGTLLDICPLMNMNTEGKLIQRAKIRGKKRVIHSIVSEMERHAENGLNYSGRCYISHSSCYDDARKVADLIESKFTQLDGEVVINSVGTVIGSHTGPGTVALFFYGDERTI